MLHAVHLQGLALAGGRQTLGGLSKVRWSHGIRLGAVESQERPGPFTWWLPRTEAGQVAAILQVPAVAARSAQSPSMSWAAAAPC